MRTADRDYDVAVLGGGLAGFAAARACARAGLETLIVERRPVLGWESTWAFQLDLEGSTSETAAAIAKAAEEAGGFRDGRLDAPILEMVLDREAQARGLSVLYYSQPVGAATDGERIGGVVVAGKSGEMVLRAMAFVDATENALLWRLLGAEVKPAECPGRFTVFLNGSDELNQPRELGALGDAENVIAKPSLWPGEVAVEFGIPTPDVRVARRAIPGVLKALRESCPECAEALVTHVGVEPFPLGSPEAAAADRFQHPAARNLFGAGLWAGGVADDRSSVAQRLDFGEEVGIAVARAFGDLPKPSESLAPSQSVSTPPLHSSEVLVCGGGTAGALAAIRAGRQGAQTTLLEASTFLGGVGSGGGIHIYYHGVTGGLQDEVDERVNHMTPLFGPPDKVQGFHPEAKKVVLQQMADEAGVSLVFETTATGAEVEEMPSTLPARGDERVRRRLRGVVAAGPDGSAVYRAEAIVDSSGDADIAFMAGVPFTFGRDTDNLPHAYSQASGRLDGEGKLLIVNFDAGYCDPTEVEDLTRARRHGLMHYWRDRFTADNRLVYIAPLIGLRNSRQIVGEYRLTLADQIAGREFPDVIAYARSHFDNHGYDYENESDEAMLWVWMLGNWQKPIGCEVPYRCLLPLEVEGLLVACRAISITHDAHNQLRMQRDLQRIGEAAGLAAALCAQRGLVPRELPVAELQSKLLEVGALGPRRTPELPQREDVGRGTLQSRVHDPSWVPPTLPAKPVPQWVAELGGENPREALMQVWQTGREALPLLLEAAKANNEDQRFWASAALAVIGQSEAVPALVERVQARCDDAPEASKAAPTWQAALVLLGRVGDAQAVPALTELLKDPKIGLDPLIAAVRALGRIGDPAAIPAIEGMLSREDLPVIRTLQLSVGPVESVTENTQWQLELAAAETLAHLGSPRLELVSRYLDDPRAYVRRYARKVERLSVT